MRIRTLGGVAATVLAGVCLVGSYALSDDKKQPTGGTGAGNAGGASAGMPDAAMMEKWQQAMTPGEHHKALERMAGDFKYVNKWRMDPNQPWETTEGTYKGEMILGGRFLAMHVAGPMMGMNFEGMGCIGYDNMAQKHVSLWIDNMGTTALMAWGTCTPDHKTYTFEGEMPDPMTGKQTKYKTVYEVKDENAFNMKMWCPDQSGQMFECMTIDYTRGN